MDTRPDSSERRDLIRKAALAPKMHRELWDKWRNELPIDAEIRHYLIFDRKFSENGAADLIAEYKATIGYAGLLEAGNMSSETLDIGENEPFQPGGQMDTETAQSTTRREPAGAGTAGARREISATVDLEGIERLKKMLDHYAEALKLLN